MSNFAADELLLHVHLHKVIHFSLNKHKTLHKCWKVFVEHNDEVHCTSPVGGTTKAKSLYLVKWDINLNEIWVAPSWVMIQSMHEIWLSGSGLLQKNLNISMFHKLQELNKNHQNVVESWNFFSTSTDLWQNSNLKSVTLYFSKYTNQLTSQFS